MNIIIKKVRLVAAPGPAFVGTRFGIRITDAAHPCFGFSSGSLADDCEFVRIDWGDGTVEDVPHAGGTLHEYAACGDYEVKITDSIKLLRVSSNEEGSTYRESVAPALRTVVCNATRLRTLRKDCFSNCRNLILADFDAAALEKIGSLTFADCYGLNGELRLMTVSDILNTEPFRNCPNVTAVVFSSVNEAAIKATDAYLDDPHLGLPDAEVKFV